LDGSNPQQTDGTLKTVDGIFQNALCGVADQISVLHKLSNTIRGASRESQDLKAIGVFRIRDDDGNDVEDCLRQILSCYIRDRFPTTSESIQQRLASSMIQRRKRILYRRKRYGTTPIRVQDEPSQRQIQVPRAQRTSQQPRELGGQQGAADQAQSQAQTEIRSLAQSATTLAAHKFHKASAPSVVSVSKTVALSKHDELCFPPAPIGAIKIKQKQLAEQREDGMRQRLGAQGGDANAEGRTSAQDWEDAVDAVGEVTCPFCFYALPARDVIDEMKWR